MQRDPSLIPLSHQHHHGLALCVLLRRSISADPSPENLARLARRIANRYELELVNHFELEERDLFPAAVEHLGPMEIVESLIAEHRSIAALVRQIARAPSPERVEDFCVLLSAHIRREENELFPELQERLPRDVLDQLGTIFQSQAVRICL
jgi:hemerythrin-like domain-containing protein